MMILKVKDQDPSRFLIWTPGWTQWCSLVDFLNSDQEYFVLAPAPMAAPNFPPAPPPAGEDEDDEPTLIIMEKADAPEPAYDDEKTQAAGPTEQFTEVMTTEDFNPKKKPDYGYFYDDFSADKIDPNAKHSLQFNMPQKKPSGRDRRVDERFNYKIEIVLVNKNGRSFKTYSENISMGGTMLEDELPKDFMNTRFDLVIINKFEKDPTRGRLHFKGRIVGDFANPRRLMFIDSDEQTLARLKHLLESYSEAQKRARNSKSSA